MVKNKNHVASDLNSNLFFFYDEMLFKASVFFYQNSRVAVECFAEDELYICFMNVV